MKKNYEKSVEIFTDAIRESTQALNSFCSKSEYNSAIREACLLSDRAGFNPAVDSEAWYEALSHFNFEVS